ncbi:MAG: family 43 glycosylhydrolase [Salinibacter sp.]
MSDRPPLLLAIGLGLLFCACGGGPTAQQRAATDTSSACSFSNPIADGADPWVVRHEDWYYLVESKENGISVYRSKVLTDLKRNEVRVWSAPDEGWNQDHIWAPELHRVNGRWYIYYAAGRDGPPFIHQRSGVLQSMGDDPQGEYRSRGRLYTGDDLGARSENIWAIDLTVGRIDGQLYAVWSGWKQNRDDDSTPQHLYIAEMENPWTMGSDRVRISSPTAPWEQGTELDINEGPTLLKHEGDTFILYSTRESWLPAYRMGQLRLEGPSADPMTPENWAKRGPVFQGTEKVHGVGHASFTTSPDGTEDWIVYHTKKDTEPGWDRMIFAQPFTWGERGNPQFGTPTPPDSVLSVPSGQRKCS